MRSIQSDYFDSLLHKDSGFNLLRSKSAHLVLSFLYQNFRLNHVQIINSDELESRLTIFLQEHSDEESKFREDEEENDVLEQMRNTTDLQIRARTYISNWCNAKEFLHRYYNNSGIAVVELNPAVERLFNWLENCEQKKFVGTESRFQNILLQLRDLNQHINTSPEKRIEELKKRRNEIDSEIKEIQKTGIVKTYTAVQIEERLAEINRNSRDLLSDFRQVEENFRQIMQGIYKKQSETENSRGTILGYTLDTDSKLRSSPQGQSFSTFWNFLSQDSDNEINTITKNIFIEAGEDDQFLLQLKHFLYEAGHKIIEQNRTLTERINGILQTQTASERKQIANLTAQIKKQMNSYVEQINSNIIDEHEVLKNFSIEIETKPDLFFPQARTLVLPEVKKDFKKVQTFNSNVVNPLDFADLYNQFFIDEKTLLSKIHQYRNETSKKQFTLLELLEKFPVEKGIAELVAWFSLSQSQEKIYVLNSEIDEIEIVKDEYIAKIKVPRLVFSF